LLQSSRVRDDCERELERGEDYAMKVVVREWVDIPISYEFRTFITHKKINAITQYFDTFYCEQIVQNKDTLLALILSLWEKASANVPFENGIIDFAITSDLSHVYIIECNPLDILTGSSLFSYYDDWEVITGRADFEFRVIVANWDKLENKNEATVMSFSPEIKRAKVIQEKK